MPAEEVKVPAFGKPKKKIEVLDVKYPKIRTRIGYLFLQKGGKLMFCCLDTKFASMIVRNIDPEVFKNIKDESEYLE